MTITQPCPKCGHNIPFTEYFYNHVAHCKDAENGNIDAEDIYKITPHTPAPWILLYNDRVTTPDDNDGSKSIAHCYSHHGYNSKANARLISAAPELLEACEYVKLSFGAITEQQSDALELVSRAIAKATQA